MCLNRTEEKSRRTGRSRELDLNSRFSFGLGKRNSLPELLADWEPGHLFVTDPLMDYQEDQVHEQDQGQDNEKEEQEETEEAEKEEKEDSDADDKLTTNQQKRGVSPLMLQAPFYYLAYRQPYGNEDLGLHLTSPWTFGGRRAFSEFKKRGKQAHAEVTHRRFPVYNFGLGK